MKLTKIAALGALAIMFASCGGASNKHDEIKDLKDTKGEWTTDQTNDAIDIYLQGLEEEAEFYETAYLINEKVNLVYHLNSYGDKDVLKERKDEIKKAEKAHDDAIKEIKKNFKDED